MSRLRLTRENRRPPAKREREFKLMIDLGGGCSARQGEEEAKKLSNQVLRMGVHQFVPLHRAFVCVSAAEPSPNPAAVSR